MRTQAEQAFTYGVVAGILAVVAFFVVFSMSWRMMAAGFYAMSEDAVWLSLVAAAVGMVLFGYVVYLLEF